MVSKPKDPNRFYFPGTKISVPLFKKGVPLSFCFVEIGCKPNGKRRQLKGGRELLFKYWADHYLDSTGEMPEIYRFLAHYCIGYEPELYYKKSPLDTVLDYISIPPGLMRRVGEGLGSSMNRKFLKKKLFGRTVEDILKEEDSKEIHALIANPRSPPWACDLRGKIAEMLVQKDLGVHLPRGVQLYRNGEIKYFNKKYQHGKEVDAILLFRGEKPIIDLVEGLRGEDHVKVRDRWHNN